MIRILFKLYQNENKLIFRGEGKKAFLVLNIRKIVDYEELFN